MILAVHTVAGALTSDLPVHWILVFLISFCSHFLIDMIPHGDHHIFEECKKNNRIKALKRIIMMDLTVTFSFIFYFFIKLPSTQHLSLFAGILGNLLPDILVAMYEQFKIKKLKKFFDIHSYFHDLIKYQPKYTITLQLILLLILFNSMV